jgi:hypothetical protein
MIVTGSTVLVIVAVISLIASSVSLYVGMRVKTDLARFEVRFMRELDERYVRTKEHNQERNDLYHEEEGYRVGTKEKIEGLAIEVYRDRDNVNVVLKDILAVLKEKK